MTDKRIFPVGFVWRDVDVSDPATGEIVRRKAMVPQPRYGNVCGRQFADGEEYVLAPLEARSRASHSHYFASVGDAFENLPEKIANNFPSAEHLRKWALIETKWFDEEDFNCPDEQFARRLAAFIRKEDSYCRIFIHRNDDGRTFQLIIYRAKSQSANAMGKDAFEASKRDVLDLLAGLINVKVSDLKKNAGRAA